ncbi:GNAT family N-acetyltransferase (plasmid) [Streptomyces sp. CA-294286]|uniref:GNAT family N-acetyltransferase n=1 Tax=Streptomyces sp. CA-294286 TaxID=3240070 RepID=UPI003D92B440
MTTADDAAYEFRTAGPEDAGALKALDASFTTSTVFHVETTENGFVLRESPVEPPLTKVFPKEDPDDCDRNDARGAADENSRVLLARGADGSLAGFVSASYAPWNRRLAIEDIEVAPEHRGRGVGRALMRRAEEFARERGAGHIWLEVTNVNVPAVRAYQRMGFALCGLDTSLYDSTASAGEYALYMSKPCTPKDGQPPSPARRQTEPRGSGAR